MKKKIFNWLFVLVMLPCMLLVNGCGKDDDKDPEDNKPTIYEVSNNAYIATSYNVTTDDLTLSLNTKEELMEYHFYTRLVFNDANGVEYQSWVGDTDTGSWDLENSIKGTYTKNENSINAILNGGTAYEETFNGVVTENSLTITIDDEDAEGTIVYTKITKPSSSSSSVVGKNYILSKYVYYTYNSNNEREVYYQYDTEEEIKENLVYLYKLSFFENKVLIQFTALDNWTSSFTLHDYSQSQNNIVIDNWEFILGTANGVLNNNTLTFARGNGGEEFIFTIDEEINYISSTGSLKGNTYVTEEYRASILTDGDKHTGMHNKDMLVNFDGNGDYFVNTNEFSTTNFYKKLVFNDTTVSIYNWIKDQEMWAINPSATLNYTINNGVIILTGDGTEYMAVLLGRNLYIHQDYGTPTDWDFLTINFKLTSTKN